MKGSSKLFVLAAALALAAGSGLGALAADKEQVIKERAALMKEQGADMGAVKGFIDGKNDLAKAEAASAV